MESNSKLFGCIESILFPVQMVQLTKPSSTDLKRPACSACSFSWLAPRRLGHCLSTPWVRWRSSVCCLQPSANFLKLWLCVSHSVVPDSATPQTVARQASLSMEVSRQELEWVAIAFSKVLLCVHAQSFQSCPTLWDPMGCRPPSISVHGIFQARAVEWVPFPPLGDLSNPGIEPRSPVAPDWTWMDSHRAAREAALEQV